MTSTTIGIIVFLVYAATCGLIYYMATNPSKIASKFTHNTEKEQAKTLSTKLRQFFYL